MRSFMSRPSVNQIASFAYDGILTCQSFIDKFTAHPHEVYENGKNVQEHKLTDGRTIRVTVEEI